MGSCPALVMAVGNFKRQGGRRLRPASAAAVKLIDHEIGGLWQARVFLTGVPSGA